MRSRILVPAILAVTFGFSGAALGQPAPMGAIEGTIDGEAMDWLTFDVPSEGTATAELRMLGPMTMLSIRGHNDVGSIMEHVLSLEIALSGPESSDVMQVTINYFPEGMSDFYVDDYEGSDTTVTLDALDLDGEGGAVSGSFSARLCHLAGPEAEVDTDDCRDVEGSFETELRMGE